jgi:NifU-like protein involved in Fe-S cluster formation
MLTTNCAADQHFYVLVLAEDAIKSAISDYKKKRSTQAVNTQ